jgi:hypothetical protein
LECIVGRIGGGVYVGREDIIGGVEDGGNCAVVSLRVVVGGYCNGWDMLLGYFEPVNERVSVVVPAAVFLVVFLVVFPDGADFQVNTSCELEHSFFGDPLFF